MKVQLIVVRGKPEGKVIPLVGPKFKIGRGETCHLRPNSEQVSREHAEFSIVQGVVAVADLGSRNGTLVNGKAITEGPCALKDRDLVQVGPLTFAVSIQDAPAPAAAAVKPAAPAAAAAAPAAPPTPAPAAAKAPAAKAPAKSAPEEVLNEEIDAWLVGEATGSGSDVPTNVYGGDTITIAAFKDAAEAAAAPPPAPVPAAAKPAAPTPVEEPEEEEEAEVEEEEEEVVMDTLDDEDEDDEEGEDDDEEEGKAPAVEEFIDESNPFYAAKKAQQQAAKGSSGGATGAGGANQQFKDTSDAATEILRKLMEKRRASK
ncbi:FHA domain-containing protein [Paludisphaera soli]|uniref:FHA domain-containing protein n=1 Tax=Paludisphaera soli TaxID=2712865 RepID=UPI0013ECFC6E|nr:FHA domain-containing protein [Paludisphaera soli]